MFRSGPLKFFVVNDVLWSCAEQYMKAENSRAFLNDHRAVELVMPKPGQNAYKYEDVRNIDSAVRDGENSVIWHLRQIPAESRNQKPPFAHRSQALG